MRRSRSDAAETRGRIVSTASKVFLERGLGAVGMRDVMAAAGLTPGGFYRHFESKEQLIAEANSAAFDRLLLMFESEIAGKSPAEAVETIVALYLGQTQGKKRPYLCPLAMIGAELSHGGAQARDIAAAGYQRLVQMLVKHLAGRSTNMTGSQAITTASGIVSMMVGAVTLANLASNREAASAILRDAQSCIEAQLAAAGAFRRAGPRGVAGRKPRVGGENA